MYTSCTSINTDKFERKEELLKYLTNVQHLNINNKTFDLYIIQVLKCGNCTESFLSYLSNNVRKNSILIFSNQYSNKIVDELKINPKIVVLNDSSYCLARYGLSNAEDLLVRFENGKIIKSQFINRNASSTFKKLLK